MIKSISFYCFSQGQLSSFLLKLKQYGIKHSVDSSRDYSNTANIFFRVFYALLIFISTLFLASNIGFLAGIGINKFYFFFALVLSLCVLVYKNKNWILSLVLFILVFFISIIIALNIWDSSYDGKEYHQIAIWFLSQGWNPIYQKMADFSILSDFLSHQIWIENYLKFAEIVQGNFVVVFDNIESGKALNCILCVMAFLYGVNVLTKIPRIDFYKAILLSFLVVFNPVVLAQIFTYYVDGLLSLVFVILVLNIIDLEIKTSLHKYIIFILAILILANIKLTGLAYALAIGFLYLVYKILQYDLKVAKKIFLCGLISALLIVLCGINPYITNILQDRNPAYPLLGKDKLDIITSQAPKSFKDLNRVEKLFISIFSKTQNITYEAKPSWKIPFLVTKDEALSDPDTRIGGFGYYFGGIVILSLAFLFLSRRELITSQGKKFIALSLLVIFTIALNPESWWARYAPQIWLLPIIVVGFGYCFQKKLSLLQALIVFFITLNIFLAFRNPLKLATHYTRDTKNTLLDIKNTCGDNAVNVFSQGDSLSFLLKLKQYGIKYHRVNANEFETAPPPPPNKSCRVLLGPASFKFLNQATKNK